MSAVLGNVEILAILDPGYLLTIVPWYAEQLINNTGMDVVDIAAAAVIAGLQIYIQNEYNDLANNYYDLYNAQRQFYYSNFQVQGEAFLLNQVFNSPLAGNGQTGTSYVPQYVAQSANVAAFGTEGAFSSVWWQNHANAYNDAPFAVGANGGHTPRGAVSGAAEPEALDKAATLADFDTYMDRYEDHKKDVYDERTWEWQNQALNFGVKQASVVESGLATSFKFLDEAAGNLADFCATQSNGLAMYAGYKRSFNETAMQLAGSTQRGSALSFSTNLGYKAVPRNMRNDVSKDVMEGYAFGAA